MRGAHLSDLAEDILSLLRVRGKLEIKEIRERLNITAETTAKVIDFLVEYGFARFDKSKGYVTLSPSYKKFLEENEN